VRSVETRTRSVTKAVTWRFLASATTFSLVWIFTGELTLAASVSVLEIILKMVIYYGHERAWNAIQWGHATEVGDED
jgi:adenylylsulfate kinase